MTENTPTQFDTRLGITIDLNPVSMADGGPGLPVELCESTIDDLRQDIAHALACIPRFAGHTLVPWTVAQHSIAVALYLARSGATRDDVLAGLLHDAHEGLGLGDIPSPAARALGPEGHAMLAAIKEHLDLLVEDVYDGNDGSRPSRMLLSRSTSAGPAPHLAADRAILLAEQALLRHRNSAPTEPVDPEAIGAVLSVAFGTPTNATTFQWCVDVLEGRDGNAAVWSFANRLARVQYASLDDARQKIAQRAVGELLELNTVQGKLARALADLAEAERRASAIKADLDASRRETDQARKERDEARKALEKSDALRVGLATEVERLEKECDEAWRERDSLERSTEEKAIRGLAERLAENLLRLVLRGGR